MPNLSTFARRYPIVLCTLILLPIVIALALGGLGNVAQPVATGYVAIIIVITVIDMVRDILRGNFGLDILAVVAMSAAIAVGEYIAAMIVVLMLSGGEALEDYAASRATKDLDALLKRAPQRAHRLGTQTDDTALTSTTDELPASTDVPVDEVTPGDILLVKPAEVIPVDGELLTANAEIDESQLTGESLPAAYVAGDHIRSGAVNGHTAIRIRATASAKDSQYQQIIALVSEAEQAKAPTVRVADRFAIPFTLVSLAVAGLSWWLSGEATRFAEVLVLATPCPLLIAAPVAFMGGMSRASREGVVVKGGATLEQLAKAKTVAFDKTGTLTHGEPELTAIQLHESFAAGNTDVQQAATLDDQALELLRLTASAEQYSTHVLAAGIIDAAQSRGLALATTDTAEEIATNGVDACIDGRHVRVGKLAFIRELDANAPESELTAGETAVYVAIDGVYAGVLRIADRLRGNAADTVTHLRGNGIEHVVILTGDNQHTADALAAQAGIAEVHGNLLPQDKVRLVAEQGARPVIMVGDGVNDAPVLAAADVGIAMGARGATAASESADAVIVRDDISMVARAVSIGRHTYQVAITAIWIGIALSLGLMTIAAFGYIPAIWGALSQELVDLAAILYALRALTSGNQHQIAPSAD
nr:heavy metal translocating P-type ATPase [Gulosibacter bifidus]